MDMFDLTAAPLRPVVARLVNVSGGPAIEFCEEGPEGQPGPLRIGRSKELPIPYRIDVGRMSSLHCEVHLHPTTLVVEMVDTSTNGTFLNGKRMEKGQRVELRPGDSVSFVNPELTGVSAEERGKLDFVFQRLKGTRQTEKIVEELTCSTCLSIFHRPFSVIPCMHVFCGHCISQSLAVGPKCPECRGQIIEVRPTHKISNLVEQLLKANPQLCREDAVECDQLNTIPPTGMIVKKRARDDSNSDDDDGNESDDSDDDNGGDQAAPFPAVGPPGTVFRYTPGFGLMGAPAECPQCTAPAADGFLCPAGQPHLRCFTCKGAFPERPLCGIPQRCALCSKAFCDQYLGGCKHPSGVRILQPIKDHDMDELPLALFGGNVVEQGVLSSHLATSGITVPMAWRSCLDAFGKGQWVPDLTSVMGPLVVDTSVCRPCCQRVFAALLYHLRRSIPRDALPKEVTDRPNCWYGKECRTQFKNVSHAQRYNHACPQEKRKE